MRILVVMPSWLGDSVMAVPALRTLRESHPGAFIGLLVRPGIDELLAGLDIFDEIHVDRARGVMGPKVVASRLRPRRYDAALLLTNSFSTALITRLASIPVRVGYDRDARGLLLTHRLAPPRRERPHRGFAPISAVDYYARAASRMLDALAEQPGRRSAPNQADGTPALPAMTLGTTSEQDLAGARLLERAGIPPAVPYAILNPGANNPAKRWPAERFAAVASHLLARSIRVLVNGSPAETETCAAVCAPIGAVHPHPAAVDLSRLENSIGALKALLRGAALLVTNDTGPRHIAAAFGIPRVTLFGPTDPRWTTPPPATLALAPERVLVAAPDLPAGEVADDHPDMCRIDRIGVDAVVEAVDQLLAISRVPGAPAPP